ncbi:MAG: hypothetical protein ACE5IK_01995, partial [Acidobacteriota bacterium]
MPGNTSPAVSTAVDDPGFFDLGLSIRTFDAPLFGSAASTTYRFLGNQTLPGLGEFTGWFSGGPQAPGYFGVAGTAIPAGRGTLAFDGGDFVFEALQPQPTSRRLTDAYALRGLDLRLERQRATVRFFGGQSRFALGAAGRVGLRPVLTGGEVLGH